MKKIYIMLYRMTAKHMPLSKKSKVAKKMRAWFGKKIMSSVGKDINIEKGAVFNPKCSLGDKSGIGVCCELYGTVQIGKFVNMGPEVIVYTRNHRTSRCDLLMQEQGYEEERPVIIEDDVWIGRRVIILPGVTIGKGSVIGAGAVVPKSIPPFSVAAGNPAKVVKTRS